MNESVYNFQDIHEDLGVKISDLGCIMADVETLQITETMRQVRDNPENDLYFSSNPDRKYINGDVSSRAHVTLLYGLMESGKKWSAHVDKLLADVDLSTVKIGYVDMFNSPFEDENYKCIVGHIETTDELLKAHKRLSYLPHINTFPEYKAHVTLAYVRNEDGIPKIWRNALHRKFASQTLRVTGINYGGW